MIGQRWFAVGVLMLSMVGVFVPSTVLAQHGPGRHGRGSRAAPAYDASREATFHGIVIDVKSGRSVMNRLLGIHTFGVGPKGTHEKRLVFKSDTQTIEIHLGPSVFLDEQKVDIRKGDRLEVIGSRFMHGESSVVLAREIRKGDSVWTLRDSGGQPLWTLPPEARGFWTKKKVLIVVVAAKVALLATVLRH
jgi:hypothetical protein